MNGPNVFNFTIRVVPELIKNVLDNNNINIDEIDYYIFHQANMFMLNHLRKKINIPKNKFIIDMESSGNTVSSTIPIVLENSEINFSGKTILLAGFGVGLSWSAVVIRNYGL
jgi:3-oxoacyl-[acyl-carrier-protein] synthase-3